MIAVGAYLRALREAGGITQEELGAAIGVAGNTIYRIEAGQQEPKTAQIARILDKLKGKVEHVAALLKPEATTKDAERYAAEARAMTDAELDRAIVVLESLRDNPKALDQWIKIGKMLADDE